MRNIVIDEEFRSLLPALDKETYALLEANIIENGCRDALVLWNGTILIDGYNRYAICTAHDIPFKTVNREFNSRDEVLIWIISNQVSRRNLTQMQLSHYRDLHYRKEVKPSFTSTQSLEIAVIQITDEFLSNFKNHTTLGETAEAKTAIKEFINRLDDIHSRV